MALSRSKKRTAILLFVCTATFAAMAPKTEARGCGWSTCGRGVVPRHGNYYFNRRPSSMFDLMSDIFSTPVYSNSLHRQSQAQSDRMVADRSAPHHEMHETEDGQVELILEVPGVDAKDLSVELEDDDRVLRIRGSRYYQQRGVTAESKFDRMFRMDDNVDMDKVSVTLSSGLLRISAPKKERKVRSIPVEVTDVQHETTIEAKRSDDSGDDELAENLNHAQEETQTIVDGLTITEEEDDA